MDLKYIDTEPSVPGWYWRRSKEGVKVVQIPLLGSVWPRPWREMRKASIEAAVDSDIRARLEELPLDHWQVEYAGPINEPSN